jgi:hypothetical protein
MFLFTIMVDNEYTAKKMAVLAKKLKYEMLWQWVKTGKGKKEKLVIACDFHKEE